MSGRFFAVLCIAVLQLGPGSASATSVRGVSLDEMIGAAELVFEGEVIGAEVRRGSAKRDIYTDVTFKVLDVVKGSYAQATIVLAFSGGTLSGQTVEVADSRRPAVGERGIYFVESLQHRQVHPLYGWSQGHFLVETDSRSGEAVVETHDRRGIYGITAKQALQTDRAALSEGVATGLRLRRRAAGETPMTAEHFKGVLREMLEEAPR